MFWDNYLKNKEIVGLKEEIAELKLQRKIEDEDIRHMIKLDREKVALEFERKVAAVEREMEGRIALVKDNYRKKMEEDLGEQLDSMRDMYSEILGRLPNYRVNHEIKTGS